MLPSFSRGLRLALVLALGAGYVAWNGHGRPAYAADDEEEEGDEGDEGDSADDAPEEGEDPDDKDQPAVTAGGLFTMASYPVSELLRPLTMTRQITQMRLGLGTDLSALGAFSSAGVSLEAVHGLHDNFMLLGGFTSAYNFKQFSFYGGFEGALLYDLVDIRLAAAIRRFAEPVFCEQLDPVPTECMDAMGGTLMGLPSGEYNAGDIKYSVDLGFPFRYAIKPEIAIIALQTLMTIDFNEVGSGRNINKVTPDLTPSVGIATNPIPALSLVVFAQLRVVDFNTEADFFKVPVTGRVEFSPNRKLDIGLEFTLLNVKPPEPQKPFDNRFLSLFMQARFGK
jgi:hypothetical protein